MDERNISKFEILILLRRCEHMVARTHIQIKLTTKDRIRSKGEMGDSYDKVINLLLDFHDEHFGVKLKKS